MTCTTCGTVLGELDMATSDKRPPTWECVNGHRQPWGEDAPVLMTGLRPAKAADLARPAWIEKAARDLLNFSECTVDIFDDLPRAVDIIERHWRQGGGK